MNRALSTAASGMIAQQMQVDTIANNIANVNTNGFKKNRLAFSSLLYQTLREPGAPTIGSLQNPSGLQVGSGTEVSGSLKLFMQGDLEPTENPLDVAINGEGFFRVQMGNGEVRYTRDGSFRQSVDGELVTSDGYRLDASIAIPADALSVSISQDGQVSVTSVNAPEGAVVGQMLVTRFPNPAGLKAAGNNLFMATASSGAPIDQPPGQQGAGTIEQSFLERSNVSVVDELVELIQAQRNYEVNSRTIRVADDMMQQAGQIVR